MWKFCLTITWILLPCGCVLANDGAATSGSADPTPPPPGSKATAAEDPAAGGQEGGSETDCPGQSGRPASTLSTTIGMEGTYFLPYAGAPLTVKPARAAGPVQLQIVGTREDCPTTIYELRYVSRVAGQLDLSRLLVGADGKTPSDLPAAVVTVRQLLPEDHNGQLEPLARPTLQPPLRYKLLLTLIGTLWLVPLLWYVLKMTAGGP